MCIRDRGILPPEVDVFGMNSQVEDFDDEDGLFSSSDVTNEVPEEAPEEVVEETEEDDDDEFNDHFG